MRALMRASGHVRVLNGPMDASLSYLPAYVHMLGKSLRDIIGQLAMTGVAVVFSLATHCWSALMRMRENLDVISSRYFWNFCFQLDPILEHSAKY
jgi:hypothetical protein